jgi:hypothetical protein
MTGSKRKRRKTFIATSWKHSWLLVPIFQIILLMSVLSQSFVQIGQIFKQRRDAAPHIRAALFREKFFPSEHGTDVNLDSFC